MNRTSQYILIVFLVFLFASIFFFTENAGNMILEQVRDNYTLSVLVYVILLATSVVAAPFTMPLFFVSGGIFGPVAAAIYNVLGWWIGAGLAFALARFLGKPILSQLISLDKIEMYERKIPKKLEFWSIVLLRVIIPVDLLSYVIGLFSTISFRRYMAATVIGITPFSIMFAYGGSAMLDGKYFVLFALVSLALLAIGIGYYIFNKR